MALTRELGEFVSQLQYRDLPADGIRVAKLGFVDCVGVMMAGSVEPVAKIVARTVLDGCDKREASLFFSEKRAAAPLAAWINGSAAHALDYDDAGGHRSAILVSTLLAEGEALGASGADMITAYVAAYEVWSELALREKGQLHERGWHPTGVYGAIAAAAAASRLRGLNAERTAAALAIAASEASGIVANFGTMVKPFHVGNNARAGIYAARLSANGMTASASAFEHERGFLAAISQHGDCDRTRPASGLGVDWRISRDGVSIKKFPMCYGTHRAIDAMLELVIAQDVNAADVEKIDVLIGKTQRAILSQDNPRTGLEAKFSIQFAMACALIERKVTLVELVDEVVQRSDMQRMMQRVKVSINPEYDPEASPFGTYDQVTLRLKSGRVLESERVKRARGHISRPLNEQELYQKFASCLDFAASDLDRRGLFDTLNNLERLPAGWLTAAIANKGRTAAATIAA